MDQTLGNRRKPRFAVKDLTISINGKTYRIFNINEHGVFINEHGVGFLIDSPDEIEIGTQIEPIIGNSRQSVRVVGIPRHVSQILPQEKGLPFTPGWVCGTEFTTQHDLEGGKLLAEYIAETIDNEPEES